MLNYDGPLGVLALLERLPFTRGNPAEVSSNRGVWDHAAVSKILMRIPGGAGLVESDDGYLGVTGTYPMVPGRYFNQMTLINRSGVSSESSSR